MATTEVAEARVSTAPRSDRIQHRRPQPRLTARPRRAPGRGGASAATGLLRRPDVAFKAMSDDTARFQVNHAQAERSRQAREHFEDTSPVAPAVRRIDRSVEFLDLVTACHSFVAAAGRVVPGLRDRQLGQDERTIVHENVARVRATLDWIEQAIDTGKVDMDDELARLLRGE
ncbi:hypothetical protein STBA_02690 [Streptomyces sp. MP131-18]|nr:hypothetical protein STBA_02690 [Streptomyces sp. MP131-18]